MTPFRQTAVMGVVALAATFSAGWLLHPTDAAPSRPYLAPKAQVPAVEVSPRLLDRMAMLDGPDALETVALDAPLEAPLAVPDVSEAFREDLAAIEQTETGPVVWLVDLDQLSGRRGVRTGELYKDGWRVARITPQQIELRRRRELRQIAVFNGPAMPED
jgi:hypothetical protein